MFAEDWTALRHEAGDRRGQDQGDEPAHRLVLLPQALRAGFRPLDQLPADRAEHHRARPPAHGFRRARNLLSKTRSCRPTATRARTGRTISSSRCTSRTRSASSPDTGNHLPDQHPPRLRGRQRAVASRTQTRRTISSAASRSGKTTDSQVDLGMIVREVPDLVVLNDEAHHIHDPSMALVQVHPGHRQPAAAEGHRSSRRSST